MTNHSEFRKLSKMLRKKGFILIRDKNHAIFERNGKQVSVSKNIRDPKTIYAKCVKETMGD